MTDSGTTGLVPSANAFGFANSWPSAPAVTVQTPFGPIGIGNASEGLCGGMVFGALDYWYAGRVPPMNEPAPGSPLYQFIVRRLIDSWHVPAGVAAYYQWMNLPDGDSTISVLGQTVVTERGVSWRTIEQQWPQVRARIDAGVPTTLGVVTVASADPGRLGANHQVLVYAYSATGPEIHMRVYDPNTGPADDIHIRFSTAEPTKATTFAHNMNLVLPVRGFFVTSYSPVPVPG